MKLGVKFVLFFYALGVIQFSYSQAVYNGSNKHVFTTDYGEIEIGPFNTGWAHIYSDRPKFIFNRPIWIQGGVLSSYSSSNLTFRTNNVTRMTILNSNGNIGINTGSPESPLHVRSGYDAIQTFQTSDDSWLYTNWKSSNGTRRAYTGLSSDLSEFRINVENGTNEIILTGGKVGVGTNSPLDELHVVGSGRTGIRVGGPSTSSGAIADLEFVSSNGSGIGGANYWTWSFRTDSWSNAPGDLTLYSHNGTSYTSPIIVQADGDVSFVAGNNAPRKGNVGIGTLNPDSKLTVNGNIHTEEVKVDLNIPGPDYVFKEDYDLKSLEEVQSYIEEHGHLPSIPSAKEMEANGIQLGEMNMKLLEKIEELTLYIIDLKKENSQLKEGLIEVKNLDKRLRGLEIQIKKIKS